jgi:hypothetical protein
LDNEQPSHRGQVQDQLSQEQFNNELDKDVAMMLTQGESDEEQGGEEGREGEANKGEEGEVAEGEDDDDDDDAEGYESPEDPFPRKPRRRPTKDELDKDFVPQEEVEIKP